MSSFICGSKHFNSVEVSLKHWFNGGKASMLSYKFAEKLQYEGETMVSDYVDTLRRLNVLCVFLQYKHVYEGRVEQEIVANTTNLLTNRGGGSVLSLVKLIKALQCINYQIEIEYLEELRELTAEESMAMQMTEKLINDLCTYIVTSSKEYDEAEWGL